MALLSFPGRSDLSPPVSTLLKAIPTPGSAVVIGPPGSGKTVLAMHLAQSAARHGQVDLLVASEHLVHWLSRAFEPAEGIRVVNWRTWLAEALAGRSGGSIPTIWHDGRRFIDWPPIERSFADRTPIDRQVIVDEAQDTPARLFRLITQHTRHVLAFADPVQRFEPDGSTLEELIDALDADDAWPVFVLEEDFRTTRQIQAFATAAWAPSRASTARPARREGSLPTVIHNVGTGLAVVAATARFLSNPAIGTVAVATTQRERAALTDALEGARIDVARKADVDGPRVRVLAFEALRGLEFDAVILALPAEVAPSWSALQAHLYVASTRARQGLAVILPVVDVPEYAQGLSRAAERYEDVPG